MTTIIRNIEGRNSHEIVRSLNGDDTSFQLKLTSQINIHRLNTKVIPVLSVVHTFRGCPGTQRRATKGRVNTMISVETDTRVF